MTMTRRRLVVAGVLAAVLSSPVAGREYRYGDIVIRVLPDLPQSTTHGYHEFPFQVINESPAESRRVTLAGPDAIQSGVSMHSLRAIERTVTVGPRSSVRLALLQPPLPAFGSGLRVSVDGRPWREVIPWSSGHPEYWVGAVGYSGGRTTFRSRRVLISQRMTERRQFPIEKGYHPWFVCRENHIVEAVIAVDNSNLAIIRWHVLFKPFDHRMNFRLRCHF